MTIGQRASRGAPRRTPESASPAGGSPAKAPPARKLHRGIPPPPPLYRLLYAANWLRSALCADRAISPTGSGDLTHLRQGRGFRAVISVFQYLQNTDSQRLLRLILLAPVWRGECSGTSILAVSTWAPEAGGIFPSRCTSKYQVSRQYKICGLLILF